MPPSGNQAAYAAFRLDEGRTLQGTLGWGTIAGQGTTKGCKQALALKESYTMHWHEYARVSEGTGGVLRYVVVEVGAGD